AQGDELERRVADLVRGGRDLHLDETAGGIRGGVHHRPGHVRVVREVLGRLRRGRLGGEVLAGAERVLVDRRGADGGRGRRRVGGVGRRPVVVPARSEGDGDSEQQGRDAADHARRRY